MSPTIYHWDYSLRSATPLNSQSSRTDHEGTLIRLESGGVGCIHPWPELGDLPLAKQLQMLKSGEESSLIRSALECAKTDGKAREQGRSLFEHSIPESHWLAQTGDDPSVVKEAGFETVKLKGSPDLLDLKTQICLWLDAEFKIRIDMNESVELREFLGFWKDLDETVTDAIELVEDPVPWKEEHWNELRDAGVKIAVDRDPEQRMRANDILVVKPARDSGQTELHTPDEKSCESEVASIDNRRAETPAAKPLLKGEATSIANRSYTFDPCQPGKNPFFVTSYMDHAIGQMWAAWKASEYMESWGGDTVLTCGLQTHHCFESNEFFERIQTKGPVLFPPEGTGLGFDDLLEKLPWKKLT